LSFRQLFQSLFKNIFPESYSDVVEFHGLEGTGKTETLYHLISRCIMPVQSGGLEVAVVCIDTDYHFDMVRLLQLLLTLHYLENTFSSQPSLGLLVIDSISSFYWGDRFNGGESTVCQEANLRKCTVIFATTHAIMRNYGSDPGVSEVPGSSSSSSRRWRSADSATDFDKPYLCKAWQRIVTHRMLFTKSPVSKDPKQVFSTACTSIMIKGVKRCSFHVMEDGIKFVCDK
uniref:X-ray repair cross complementing 2 n=1 Tax=Sinocyclocheilus rhinocerous TaxID=307959 RepID=A0A673NP12_9TELE